MHHSCLFAHVYNKDSFQNEQVNNTYKISRSCPIFQNSLLDGLGGVAGDDGPGGDVVGDDCAGGDNGAFADFAKSIISHFFWRIARHRHVRQGVAFLERGSPDVRH